jgi:hypothetical protein
MSLEELVDTLSTLGVAHEVRRSGAEGALLFLPEFGRLLGIWPHFRAENALWVNPGFLHSLRVGVKDDAWNGPGGDRVWLAPGAEFLGEDGAIPPAIDPGRYALSSDRNGLTLASRGEALARRTGVRVRFRITRRLRPLDEAEIDAACGQTYLRRSGCAEELELEIEDTCPVPVRLWSIAQAPPGSELHPGDRKLVCVEDGESDRARLLVKACEAGDPSRDDSGSAVGVPRGRPVELALVSPAMAPDARRRILQWKAFLYSFSGRSAEVRQFASRMVY